MKNNLSTCICALAALLLIAAPTVRAAVIDDFSDLNDTANPAWTHLTGDANSTGQTFDASTGQYRLTAPPNSIPISGNRYGVAGSYVQPAFSDVNVTADLVQNSNGYAYGVAAHLDGNNGFNLLKGYAYMFEQGLNQPIGVGEMVLYRISGLSLTDIGNDNSVPFQRSVTLDFANKDYTFSLDIVGNTLYGTLREVGGGLVAYQQQTDSPPGGFPTSGYSGVMVIGAASTTLPLSYPGDVTFDNFRTDAIPEPASMALAVIGLGALVAGRRHFRG